MAAPVNQAGRAGRAAARGLPEPSGAKPLGPGSPGSPGPGSRPRAGAPSADGGGLTTTKLLRDHFGTLCAS